MKTPFDAIRIDLMEKVGDLLAEYVGDKRDVLRTGSQELCIPIIGDKGEEGYMTFTFAIPRGSRDGDPYDGYEVAEAYKFKLEQDAEKKRLAEEKKKKKIERDAEIRRKKKEKKEKREDVRD